MPVLGSGTFKVSGAQLINISGVATWSPGGSLPATSWLAFAVVAGSGGWESDLKPGFSVLTLSGYAGGAYFVDNVPDGFTPTTNLFGTGVDNLNQTNASDSITVNIGSWSETVSGISSTFPPIPIPDNTPWSLILTANKTVSFDEVGTFSTPGQDPPLGGGYVTGNYDIVYWWWILPLTDACGNPQTSRLALAGAPNPPGPPEPAGNWMLLDPSSPDTAQPTVVVNSVEPSIGLTTGGTAVTIKGSGFGDGATVAFDGDAATSVVIVDQFTITCDSPAHAAGTGNVIVTNLDGSHN